jgi:hypothetical protein
MRANEPPVDAEVALIVARLFRNQYASPSSCERPEGRKLEIILHLSENFKVT